MSKTTSDTIATPPDPNVTKPELRRAAWSSWLGSSLEYMDFTLYTLASALVFGPLFFPNETPAVALISSLGVYGSGFAVRPIGGYIFGRVGDKHGRRIVLIVTLSMMGIATMGIGLLPTYAQIGIWAPVFLVILRLVQGFGAGAELAGASVLLVESSPVRRRGLFGAIVAMGTNSGIYLATVLWTLLSLLPDEAFLSWGWRVPFLLSIVTTFVALAIRTKVRESPVFEEAKERRAELAAAKADQPSILVEARRSTKSFLLALGIRMGENSAVYLVKGFMVGWVVTTTGIESSIVTTGIMIGTVIGFATVPFFGKLSDKLGRRPVFLGFSLFQILFSIPAMLLIDTGNPILIACVFAVFVGGPLPNLYGVESSWLVELFGSKHRYTFMTTIKEIGSVVSGGLAPVIAASLVAVITDSWWPVAIVLILFASCGLVGAWFAPETRGRDLTAEADAVDDRSELGAKAQEVRV
ncbi:MFS transporter [Brevibacterium aurantiacum]|uniref:MFS transporter n=1 Tax=Brevibacterium aurantiacum TaxID=273384 RepID=A0A2A3ZME0_BREAU|nr:MFS transporter [Brevibacterium aurantiacum]MDN5735491.1 MHS family MFS transporter [Brevibacterium aurantiacum]PCC52717.1 MFS transporter [Brevibacterium aurantiacum]